MKESLSAGKRPIAIENPAWLRGRLGSCWQMIRWVGNSFWENRCQVRASALAYTTLLALVPMLAVSLSVASLVFDPKRDDSQRKLGGWIETFVENVAPALGLNDQGGEARRQEIAGQILAFVQNIHFGTIGVTGMVSLIFVAISLLRTVEAALNDIWHVRQGRTWFQSVVIYWAVITLGPIILLFALGSGYLGALESGSSWVQGNPLTQWIGKLSVFVPLVLLTLFFGALFQWMPNTHVDWRAALLGAAVAAALWWGNNQLGALYNTKVVTYSKIYGSLGAIPLFLAGMYLSWLILLFGAQTAYVFQHRESLLQQEIRREWTPTERETAAVSLFLEIGESFSAGKQNMSENELANRLNVASPLVGELCEHLSNAHLLRRIQAKNPTWIPARPLEQISLWDVLLPLRSQLRKGDPLIRELATGVVSRHLNEISEISENHARKTTIAHLVAEKKSSPIVGAVIAP